MAAFDPNLADDLIRPEDVTRWRTGVGPLAGIQQLIFARTMRPFKKYIIAVQTAAVVDLLRNAFDQAQSIPSAGPPAVDSADGSPASSSKTDKGIHP
jgi:hypothetical protein